ncbi:unnamed protein product [Somion occarium]|uniref:Uncharacterized protein n=1 Tax=Somion occarium TaxID=3059160 RepID=A0ABP1DFH4_9APHY
MDVTVLMKHPSVYEYSMRATLFSQSHASTKISEVGRAGLLTFTCKCVKILGLACGPKNAGDISSTDPGLCNSQKEPFNTFARAAFPRITAKPAEPTVSTPFESFAMLFTKVLYPLLAVFGVASLAFASPIAEPAAGGIEIRQANSVLDVVQGLQSAVAPIVSQLEQAATTGQDPTALLGELRDVFTSSTSNVKNLKASPSSFATADITAIVSIVLNIFLDVVVVLGKFPILSVVVSANVDVFLSAFLSALNAASPGIATQIGKGIPGANVSVFVVLQLVAVIRILGITIIL